MSDLTSEKPARKVVFRVPRSPQPPEPRPVTSKIPKFVAAPSYPATRDTGGVSGARPRSSRVGRHNSNSTSRLGPVQSQGNSETSISQEYVTSGRKEYVSGQRSLLPDNNGTDSARSKSPLEPERQGNIERARTEVITQTSYSSRPSYKSFQDGFIEDCPVEVSHTFSESYNDSFASLDMSMTHDQSVLGSPFQKRTLQSPPTTPLAPSDGAIKNRRFPKSSLKGPHRSLPSTTKATSLQSTKIPSKKQVPKESVDRPGPSMAATDVNMNVHTNSSESGHNYRTGEPSEESEVFLEFALQCLTEMCLVDSSSRADGSSLHTEQTLHGLKKELERCLTMYRAKRQQVAGLQEELRATRHSLEDVGARLEEAQQGAEESARRLAEYEAEVGPLGGAGVGQETVQERRLQRQIDSLSRDKRMLDEEVKVTPYI